MANFAQYYLEFKLDNMFAQPFKTERQKLFGALLKDKESISFTVGSGEEQKTYKHEVVHLKLNKDIIIMRIANKKDKEVIQDFKKKHVNHEPPCFVIIDNRKGCRRIAIQKCPDAFSNTRQVSKILTQVIGSKMAANYFIGISLHPQYYPQDFYKAWRMHQFRIAKLRFNFSDGEIPAEFRSRNMDDDSITGFAIRLMEDNTLSKYRPILELMPPPNETILPLDDSTPLIRNLVSLHAQTGAPIELVAIDGTTYTCFINDDQESSRIVTSEIDTHIVEALFEDTPISLQKAEEEILKFVNNMKYTVDEDERTINEEGRKELAS